jgi:hypothetical protein
MTGWNLPKLYHLLLFVPRAAREPAHKNWRGLLPCANATSVVNVVCCCCFCSCYCRRCSASVLRCLIYNWRFFTELITDVIINYYWRRQTTCYMACSSVLALWMLLRDDSFQANCLTSVYGLQQNTVWCRTVGTIVMCSICHCCLILICLWILLFVQPHCYRYWG